MRYKKYKTKKCMKCGKQLKNPNHDYCYKCFQQKESEDELFSKEEHFENSLIDNRIYTVYIMFYKNKEKIGYTGDLNSRLIEIKRKYPKNSLVYFREFSTESEARRFEAWLKTISNRELNKFISAFQDKIKKIKGF